MYIHAWRQNTLLLALCEFFPFTPPPHPLPFTICPLTYVWALTRNIHHLIITTSRSWPIAFWPWTLSLSLYYLLSIFIQLFFHLNLLQIPCLRNKAIWLQETWLVKVHSIALTLQLFIWPGKYFSEISHSERQLEACLWCHMGCLGCREGLFPWTSSDLLHTQTNTKSTPVCPTSN